MKIKHSRGVVIVCLTVLTPVSLISFTAQSAPGDMTFSGTLVAPPSCVINGDKDVNVDFGKEILTTKIDGKNYEKDAKIDVSCVGTANYGIKMQLFGLGTDFDSRAIKTTKDNIAIAIYKDGKRLGINEWFTFTYPNVPLFKLVPVRKPNAPLTGGAFSGYVTIYVDYE